MEASRESFENEMGNRLGGGKSKSPSKDQDQERLPKPGVKSLPNFPWLIGIAVFLIAGGALAGGSSEWNRNWPQWRGPLATGVALEADPPIKWSESENVRWKVAIPGFGTSTPIVWGEKVFVLSAEPTGKKAENQPADSASTAPAPGGPRMSKSPDGEIYRFLVHCIDRKTGKTLWMKAAREEAPHEGHHPDHGYASASPSTDGQVLVAYFGSRGLHCYDLKGEKLWEKDLGKMRTRNSFGEGASPVLHKDVVVAYQDDEGSSDFIAAFDKKSGKELWRTPRDEPTGWSTPLVVEHGGKAQVIVNATGKVRSYDLATGKELWNCAGQTANSIPSPVSDGETVFVTSGFRGSALYAFALDGSGDLAGSQFIRWKRDKNTPYAPSPLLMGGALYTVTGNNGVLSCFDSKTGNPYFEGERLEGISGIYASPVSAMDRVYVLGRNGLCLVVKTGPKLEVLASNKLDDKTDASLALTGRDLFVRGHKNVYCITAP